MTEFHCGTRIISGPGALARLGSLGARRMLVVTDPYFSKNGTAKQIGQLAPSFEIFDRIAPDPTVELAAEGTAALQKFDPDLVVALGGGSAMDCAKAMVYFSGRHPKLAAVPTTSGSGSEVTDFAILTHGGTKHPLVDESIRPQIAILDEDLLKNLPPALIADSGFDVLSHAMEALGAKNAGAISDALARDAFCAAFAALPGSFAGVLSKRMPIHCAATMAGMAFSQAGLGLCHAMSHVLGGRFHLPHGRLNAILLPAVMEYNASEAGAKYAALARAAGLGGSGDLMALRNLKNALTRLRQQLKMPATLAEAGVPISQLRAEKDAILTDILADPCCATNPVEVTAPGAWEVCRMVTG